MTAFKQLFGFERVSLSLALCSVAVFSWLVFANPLPSGTSAPKFSFSVPVVLATPLELVDLFPRRRGSAHATLSQGFTVDRLSDTFTRIGYDLEQKSNDTFQVPRFYLASLPRDMAAIREAGKRKILFFKTVLPLVLKANEEILANRARLWQLHFKPSWASA